MSDRITWNDKQQLLIDDDLIGQIEEVPEGLVATVFGWRLAACPTVSMAHRAAENFAAGGLLRLKSTLASPQPGDPHLETCVRMQAGADPVEQERWRDRCRKARDARDDSSQAFKKIRAIAKATLFALMFDLGFTGEPAIDDDVLFVRLSTLPGADGSLMFPAVTRAECHWWLSNLYAAWAAEKAAAAPACVMELAPS